MKLFIYPTKSSQGKYHPDALVRMLKEFGLEDVFNVPIWDSHSGTGVVEFTLDSKSKVVSHLGHLIYSRFGFYPLIIKKQPIHIHT